METLEEPRGTRRQALQWGAGALCVLAVALLTATATAAASHRWSASAVLGGPATHPALSRPLKAPRLALQLEGDHQFAMAGPEAVPAENLAGDATFQSAEPRNLVSCVMGLAGAVATGAAAFLLGRSQRNVSPEEPLNEVEPLSRKRQSWALAAVSGASGSQDSVKFMAGLFWFFAHQLIGVGNDVIMKSVGGNLAVAQIVFLRFAFATLTMLPFMAASGPEAFQTARLPLHLARSVLLAGGIGLYCMGLTIAPIAVVTTLNFTIPLFTLLLSRVVLKEKVGPLRWCATLAGFVGVMLVLQPGHVAFNPQWLVVLLGATLFSSLDVLNKYFVGKESFWAMIFYTALFTAGISAYPAYQVWAPVTGAQLRLLAALGAGANLLLYCLLKAFSLLDASALAPFRYTELLLSALVGFLFFAEVPAMATLLGAAVIIPSALFVVWQESQAKDGGDAAQPAAT